MTVVLPYHPPSLRELLDAGADPIEAVLYVLGDDDQERARGFFFDRLTLERTWILEPAQLEALLERQSISYGDGSADSFARLVLVAKWAIELSEDLTLADDAVAALPPDDRTAYADLLAELHAPEHPLAAITGGAGRTCDGCGVPSIVFVGSERDDPRWCILCVEAALGKARALASAAGDGDGR